MPVPSTFADLSTTPATNPPAGGESATEGDNHLRQIYALLRSIMSNSANGWVSPYSTPAAVTAAVAAAIAAANPSGSYTPTGTIVSNVDVLTPGLAVWNRSGNVVHVAGVVTVDTTAGGSCSFKLSLPVASNMSSNAQLSGVCVIDPAGGVSSDSMAIIGDTVADLAQFRGSFGGSFITTMRYCYSYIVA
jgi:hypothetical protein